MLMQPILKESYLNDLEAAIGTRDRLGAYRTPGQFELDESRLFRETSLELRQPLPELVAHSGLPGGGRASSDCENAIALHAAMPSMDATVATDRRLWACLTHGLYFEYSRLRWPIPTDDVKARVHIREHWFFKRGLRRNAVARLWWAAEMTVAPWKRAQELGDLEKADEYHYTRIMLRHQDIWQGVVERDFGHNLRVRICALEALDAASNHAPNLTTLATRFTKDVNLLGTHTDLSSLDTEVLQVRLNDLALRCCDGVS
jgi:hypothetical protein